MGNAGLNRINNPYPFIAERQAQLLISISFGLFIFLFLMFFRPFGLGDMNVGKSLFVLGFGVITSATMFLNFILGTLLVPTFFNEDTWTIKRELLLGLWNIILITLFNYIYNAYVGGQGLHLSALLAFVIITASVGIFPLSFLVLARELYLTDRSQKTASRVSEHIKSAAGKIESSTNQEIVFKESSGTESLQILEKNIVFIRASDNYCEIHYIKEKKLSSRLLRITLKTIEDDLKDNPDVIRCHRSYLVNRQKISSISGNARAYTLHLSATDERIPVSRSMKISDLVN